MKQLILFIILLFNFNIFTADNDPAKVDFNFQYEYKWWDPSTWGAKQDEKKDGIRDTINHVSKTAHRLSEHTLPEVENTLKSVQQTLNGEPIDKALKEIAAIRLETLEETRKLREMGDRFINTLNAVPKFLKTLIIMTLGASTTLISARYIFMPGINNLIRVYNKTKPRPELKNTGLTQMGVGLLIASTGIGTIAKSWHNFTNN